LFGNISDTDLDRVAFVDTITGSETIYRGLIDGIEASPRSWRLADRRWSRRGAAPTQQFGVRSCLSWHSAGRRDRHHVQRVRPQTKSPPSADSGPA